jgi:hypothetical protein
MGRSSEGYGNPAFRIEDVELDAVPVRRRPEDEVDLQKASLRNDMLVSSPSVQMREDPTVSWAG